jgi:hypothetical protein
MIIQAILIAILLIAVAQVVYQRLSPLVLKLIGVVLLGVGVLLVLRPSLANAIAHLLGVGRGADLLLYFAVTGGSLLLFRLYLRIRGLELREAQLVRELALIRYSLEK